MLPFAGRSTYLVVVVLGAPTQDHLSLFNREGDIPFPLLHQREDRVMRSMALKIKNSKACVVLQQHGNLRDKRGKARR